MLFFRNLAAATLIAGAPMVALAQTAAQPAPAAPAATVPDVTAPATTTPDEKATAPGVKSARPMHKHRHHAAKPAASVPQH